MNYETDIKLDDRWQLTPHASGDLLLVSDKECLLQDIRLEAVTMEGDLFYDEDYGWGLQEFAQQPDSNLLRLELAQRIKSKLAKRENIDVKSVVVTSSFGEDSITVNVRFRLLGEDELLQIDLSVGRIKIEVIEIDT